MIGTVGVGTEIGAYAPVVGSARELPPPLPPATTTSATTSPASASAHRPSKPSIRLDCASPSVTYITVTSIGAGSRAAPVRPALLVRKEPEVAVLEDLALRARLREDVPGVGHEDAPVPLGLARAVACERRVVVLRPAGDGLPVGAQRAARQDGR